MKVLFLDIDGVVNNESTRQRHRGVIGIDPELAFRVGKIHLYVPDLKVVLSSSWRHMRTGREEVEQQVVPIYDVTGNDSKHGLRGEEIQMWLDAHPEVEKYAIIDDDSDMLEEQKPNFFKTKWREGITDEIMNSIIEHFNGKDSNLSDERSVTSEGTDGGGEGDQVS